MGRGGTNWCPVRCPRWPGPHPCRPVHHPEGMHVGAAVSQPLLLVHYATMMWCALGRQRGHQVVHWLHPPPHQHCTPGWLGVLALALGNPSHPLVPTIISMMMLMRLMASKSCCNEYPTVLHTLWGWGSAACWARPSARVMLLPPPGKRKCKQRIRKQNILSNNQKQLSSAGEGI